MRKIYSVSSRASVRIEASELMLGGDLSIYPTVEDRGYFSVQFRGRYLELFAHGHCGLIPINEMVAIDVQPKMPVANIHRLFEVANLPLVNVAPFSRGYDGASLNAGPILVFLAQEFAASLDEIIAHGIKKRYLAETLSEDRPRGRLLIERSIAENWARGRLSQYTSQRYTLKQDTPENRALRRAGQVLYARLVQSGNGRSPLAHRLAASLAYFGSVGGLASRDLTVVAASRRKADHSADGYSVALDLATLVLSGQAPRFDTLGTELDLSAVVVNFDDLFERYVRGALVSASKVDFPTLRVLDGNLSGKRPLFDDRKRPTANPDIVIAGYDGRPLLVGEVKYKSYPDRDNINQAITYAVVYRVPIVYLIHQAATPAESGMRLIGTTSGIEVRSYGLDLTSDNLQNIERDAANHLLGAALPPL